MIGSTRLVFTDEYELERNILKINGKVTYEDAVVYLVGYLERNNPTIMIGSH
ncbi:M20 family metallo-hydrolase [Natranaerobius trueperi]|uniref:M20 family metallo-hydrolase n=1 Tax=Natranaerobius trueperi TaxID=759412 RepID=UPI00117D9121|nr:M20 family metallo-hydrolase [Natranaerobius trueperi]